MDGKNIHSLVSPTAVLGRILIVAVTRGVCLSGPSGEQMPHLLGEGAEVEPKHSPSAHCPSPRTAVLSRLGGVGGGTLADSGPRGWQAGREGLSVSSPCCRGRISPQRKGSKGGQVGWGDFGQGRK